MRGRWDLPTQFPCLLQAEATTHSGHARERIQQLLHALILDLAQQGVVRVDHDRRGALQEVSVVDQGRWDRAVGSMFCGRYLHLIAAASGIACAAAARDAKVAGDGCVGRGHAAEARAGDATGVGAAGIV